MIYYSQEIDEEYNEGLMQELRQLVTLDKNHEKVFSMFKMGISRLYPTLSKFRTKDFYLGDAKKFFITDSSLSSCLLLSWIFLYNVHIPKSLRENLIDAKIVS